VLAFAGWDVILPCSFNITDNDFPTVEWSKEGLQPNVVFLYRDGCETHEMKNPAFEYRTSFINSELQNGNVSLRISDVQLSDAGKYQCMRLWKNAPRDITTVELVVGAAHEPKLSVISAESGGVILQCEATCWLLEPDVTFLDDQGNNIPADDPRRHQDTSGCYTVTRRVTLQDATNSVTCRVHQPKINQTRNTQILIPVDCMRSCLLPTVIAVGVTVSLLLATCGSAVFVWKRREKSACLRVSPDRSQFFWYESITLSCEDPQNSTGWMVKRRTSKSGVRPCANGWGSKSFSSTCIIENTYPTDSGVYWCESKDREMSNSVNITITAEKSSFGQRFDFYKDGLCISSNSTGEMTIHSASKSDEGFYMCSISGGGESLSSWLAVKGRPVILESPTLPVLEGDSVSLRCKAAVNSINHRFNFFKDGLCISSNSTGEMTIHSASKSDEGFYKCSISGGAESVSSWLAVEAAQLVPERRGSNDVIMEIAE
ncbi:Butyrophilin subfamily 1 member A1, partial [Nibea albiflora]